MIDANRQHPLLNHELRIAGKAVAPASGEYFDTEDPYTGRVWARIARGNERDVELAVEAAQRAFPAWSGMRPADRARLMHRLADLVTLNADRLARLEVRDNGKLLMEMLPQIQLIAEWFHYFAGLTDKIHGSVVPTGKPDILTMTRLEPLGVVAIITPWNSPLLLLTHKLATALAAGNVAVIKPSEFASVSTLAFAELFDEAGFPSGTVNVVTGFAMEAGVPLVAHIGVAKVAFTGSESGGRKINEAAAATFKHVSLELGGKSPNIVFDDADLDAAVVGGIAGIFAASGQTCIAGSRLLLQRGIHDQYIGRLLDMAGQARLGDPMLPETNVGPVATAPQLQKVLDYIAIARAEGADCLLGGGRMEGTGNLGGKMVLPTIFSGVHNGMRIAREEVFGPVLSIIPFDDEEDAYRIANDTNYGLAAGVWTSDMGRAIRASERLQAGTVWINTYRIGSYATPFGGYKHSGIGREGGVDSMREWLQTKTVWFNGRPNTAHPFVMRT